MKNFHIVLKSSNKKYEYHFVTEENYKTLKFPLDKNQFNLLSEEEKNIYIPSEFCISEEDAKELIQELIQLIPFENKLVKNK